MIALKVSFFTKRSSKLKLCPIWVTKFIFNITILFLEQKNVTINANNPGKSKILDFKKEKRKKLKPAFDFHFNNLLNTNYNNNNNLVKLDKGMSNAFLGDNFSLTKRITEKGPVYSRAKWLKEFKMSRVYKKISCEYPSINFIAKKKRKMKSNFVFGSKKEDNILGEISFKPFASFDNNNTSSGSGSSCRKCRSISKKRRKKRNLGVLHKEIITQSCKKNKIDPSKTK